MNVTSTPTLALLNQSEFLPNQLMHGAIGLVIFAALFLLSRRRRSLWASYLKVAAYFHIALFFGVLVFKISGAGFFEEAALGAFPFLDRFHPFEPAAHMIQELATMGAYSYLAVVYLRREYPNVFERPMLHFVLGTAFPVYGACWVAALAVGLAHPFPMTGLDTELNSWSVLYRGLILLPGVFYCSIFVWVFWEASGQKAVAPSARRLKYLGLGALCWALVCAEQFAWAIVHAEASPSLREALAAPHVIAEGALYFFMGATWLAALLVSYRISPAERNIQDYMNYLRRMRHLKTELADLYRMMPHWRLTADRLGSASRALGLSDDQREQSLLLVQLASLPYLKRTCDRTMIQALEDLRDRLLERLPPDSDEVAVLSDEPEGRCLGPALLLLDDPPPDVSRHDKSTQLAAATLNTMYVFNRLKRYGVSPEVERALAAPPEPPPS